MWGARWEERAAGPSLSPKISPPGTAIPWAEPSSQTWAGFVLLSPTGQFWPPPSVCSHPAGMLWEPLPREWGADSGEDPSCPCFTASASPRQAQLGTMARWTPLLGLSPQHLHVDRQDSQGQATAATTHPPPPLPQASLLFQPCHQFSAVVLPTPSSSSSSSQRPGAARTKQDQLPYSSASGKSLPITVPTCPSLSLCPHLSPALLLTNQLFIARRVPLGPSFLHLGEAAARPCFPSLIHTAPAPQEPLLGSVRGCRQAEHWHRG